MQFKLKKWGKAKIQKQGKNLSCGKKHNLEFEKQINRLRLLCSSSRR